MKTKKQKPKKQDTIFQGYIKDRIFNKNKNFFMVIVGSTGSGKSYSALRLAELLDDSFTINECCFKAKEFLMKIKKFQDLAENNQEETKGKVIMFDEIGVEHDSKRFMTISNRVINYFFQTSRYLNLIVIMTVPFLSFIDSSTRKLCHCIAETKGINQRTKQVTLKVKFLQVAPFSSKEYPKYLRFTKMNKHYSLQKIKVGLPSEKLRNDYEKKKREYGNWLYEDSLNKLERYEDKEKAQQSRKPLTQTQEKVAQLLSKHSAEETAGKLGIALGSLYGHKVNIEKKGYIFKPIWENKRIIRYEIQGLTPNSDINADEPQF
jgi:DNA-binding CsgD family transcriptional regulator